MHSINTQRERPSAFARFKEEFAGLLAGLFPMLFPGTIINIRLGGVC